MLSRSIHIVKVVTFNILEVHNHYMREDSYLYSCSWAPLSAPAVLVALFAPQMLEGIAHNSALVWSFARRCRLGISAVWEVQRKNGIVQPLHECSFIFHKGLYRIYTKKPIWFNHRHLGECLKNAFCQNGKIVLEYLWLDVFYWPTSLTGITMSLYKI